MREWFEICKKIQFFLFLWVILRLEKEEFEECVRGKAEISLHKPREKWTFFTFTTVFLPSHQSSMANLL